MARNTLSDIFEPQTCVLWDGGLGTTLADVYSVSTDTSIWSSQVVEESPDTLVDCHFQFLQAGAQILNTATYQAAFSTYALANRSAVEATAFMRRAVSLAADARTRFLTNSTSSPCPKIALSLGAFGAALVPVAHEFDGVYPPPYGPLGSHRASFTPTEASQGLEEKSVEALATFHHERLRVFADDAPTWATLDLLAFETLPLAREIRAARRAVGRFPADERLPFVVSTVWQDGVFPEGGAREIVNAAFGGAEAEGPTPDGLGVNCTLLENVRRIVPELEEEVRRVGVRPWLLLKPNGGQVFDPIARTWSAPAARDGKESWVQGLASVVRCAKESRVWAGVMVGGCCKTSFEEVRGLGEVLGSP